MALRMSRGAAHVFLDHDSQTRCTPAPASDAKGIVAKVFEAPQGFQAKRSSWLTISLRYSRRANWRSEARAKRASAESITIIESMDSCLPSNSAVADWTMILPIRNPSSVAHPE